MQNEFMVVINRYEEELSKHIQEAKRLRATINDLCRMAGLPERYPGATTEHESTGGPGIKSDQFYGRALATVVREYLELRKAAGQGAATVSEIYDALKAGDYKFDAKTVENAKRGLRISLSKNTTTFHRLPSGRYGLREWYPVAAEQATQTNGRQEGDNGEVEAEDEGEKLEGLQADA